jgi:predicted regulator of Ras-like GTPase activity (Roadblock/LC7/MglB family)
VSATPQQVRQWSEEVARDPGSMAFVPLAAAYRSQGRQDAALRLCIRGLERNPTNVEAHYLLGLLYREAGDGVRAFDEWDIALHLSPEHRMARRAIGLLCADRGEWAAAARHLSRAATDNPADAEVAEALANARQRAGGIGVPVTTPKPQAETQPASGPAQPQTAGGSVDAPRPSAPVATAEAPRPASPASSADAAQATASPQSADARPATASASTDSGDARQATAPASNVSADVRATTARASTVSADAQPAIPSVSTDSVDAQRAAAPSAEASGGAAATSDHPSPAASADAAGTKGDAAPASVGGATGEVWDTLEEEFRGFAAERGVVGAVLLDDHGYVLAGEMQVNGRDRGPEIAAVLSGASSEAERAIRHLGLGKWRGILLETPDATVRIAPTEDGGMLAVAARREVPTGRVLRVAARALDAAARFAGSGGGRP